MNTIREIDDRHCDSLSTTGVVTEEGKLLTVDSETGEVLAEVNHKPEYYRLVYEVSPDLALCLGSKALGLLHKLCLTIHHNNISTSTLAEANTNATMGRYPPLDRKRLSEAKAKLLSLHLIIIEGSLIIVSPLIAWKGDYSVRESFIRDELHSLIVRQSGTQ